MAVSGPRSLWIRLRKNRALYEVWVSYPGREMNECILRERIFQIELVMPCVFAWQ